MVDLPGKRGSCWVAGAGPTGYSPLDGSIHAETVVVGGGIVGLTAALRLSEAGRSVILLEALEIGGQVTGRSTAKITTQHALIYRHLIDSLGLARARSYAEANSAGAALIKDWIRDYAIACDLERKNAYTYATSSAGREAIIAEAETARQVGLEAQVLDRAPLPFETTAAVCFPGEAQFNPAKYLVGLARAAADRGARLFEQSRAILIDVASRWRVVTSGGTVHAEHVVVATNMTVKSPVGMANRTQPRCHTAIAFRVDSPLAVDGMFIGIDDPTHSIRTGRDDAGPLLVVLGPKFNTGQDGNVAARFIELEEWARQNLAVGELAWHWCNEDYDTADRVPYVGEPDPEKAPGFHIATGFNAWGISNGTAAGIMIADTILGRASPWRSLYDPTRPYPKGFHKNGDSQSIVGSARDIRPGEGGVVLRGDEKLAVCRDDDGTLRAVSASCTHKGCTVTWNNADRTWDCPCHGSIFAADGSVIHGPARKPLAPAEL
ncbi:MULTISPECIES: FAD-dependent oxidoreductase [Sinorhizobium]|uniref:Oxidoreductase n=2 Tax=Sinorhizobium TaxID=28105 RepID=A0A2S3YS29_9HYPH|nr:MULTISPECIES: FAD-dependent oxidoreductase [Sinorhizobium]AUX80222.1 FAD dependent oxidoreductase protein [Sinorhizobium fredii]PDT43402.1 FAD-dependent oxidoreductase [Sinorhizobium sp. FG01]PDT52946.1 FAD-dependent oxidoreductase [Sinorhizobium sp. NG07B]POH29115.1 oxidoreductase [Sinorhizobium americanum]POH34403.1 oxidoreductase [Sinorhizobium americanum]